MDEKALAYALRLLQRRDYSRRELEHRVSGKFGPDHTDIFDWLARRDYLNDRRYAERFVDAHPEWARQRMDAELGQRGIDATTRIAVLADHSWPSLREAVSSSIRKMSLSMPIDRKAAARIARILVRRGYDPVEIGDELERHL